MAPQRYRRRPAEVTAIRFDGTNHAEIERFTGGLFASIVPADRVDDPDQVAEVFGRRRGTWLGVKLGAWIVEVGPGDFLPVAVETFEQDYEPAP